MRGSLLGRVSVTGRGGISLPGGRPVRRPQDGKVAVLPVVGYHVADLPAGRRVREMR